MKEEKMDKKDLILTTAENLFSLHGYDGTSTRSIAMEAGVNLAMLNYYFGSKEGLYKAVLEKRLSGFHQLLASINEEDISSWHKLGKCVDLYVNRIMSQNSFHRLVHREVSLEQRSESGDFICQNMLRNFNEVRKILVEGIENGSFREVDVEFTVASLFGTKYFIVNLVNLTSQMLGMDLRNPQVMENEVKPRVKQHLMDLLNAHLKRI